MIEALNLIRSTFSRNIFTEKDFNRLIKPQTKHLHTKHLLHALAMKGKLIRYGSGRYKVA